MRSQLPWQSLWQLQPRHSRWKTFTGASQGLISIAPLMLIMHFALHASSSFNCTFNFHTLLHTPCTVLVRCFARWRSVRKTLSSWRRDRTPAGCWQVSSSHLPSVETLVLGSCLWDMIFHQRVFIRTGLLCTPTCSHTVHVGEVTSPWPLSQIAALMARYPMPRFVLQKDVSCRGSLLAIKNDLDVMFWRKTKNKTANTNKNHYFNLTCEVWIRSCYDVTCREVT